MKIVRLLDSVENQGLKAIVYGDAGSGKTRSIATIPNREKLIVLSAEAGLLSLRKIAPDINVVNITDADMLRDAYADISKSDYDTVVIDSLSEVAQQILSKELADSKDGRKAYGEMFESVIKLVKAFRDMSNKNIIFICQQERIKTDTGALIYAPSMPGQKAGQAIPYITDLVLIARKKKDTVIIDGVVNEVYKYAFQTSGDLEYVGKDRSGELDTFEPQDWTHIFNKVKGV